MFSGNLMTIVEFQHVKPGKGGAFVRTKLKNIITGRVIDKTFRSGEKIEIIRLEDKEMQFLYTDDDSFIFMDQETFDQIYVKEQVVGDAKNYMNAGDTVSVLFHEETPLSITVPFFLNFKIVECEPGLKGDTVSNVTKGATIETGAVIQVPLFVERDEIIRVDTRTGTYIERVRE